jgi:hypothetical protein
VAQNFNQPTGDMSAFERNSDRIDAIRAQSTNPNPTPQTGNTFTGEWSVRNEQTGEEVHRFGGIGNSQADANRVAQRWATQARFNDPIEVVPVMRESRTVKLS